MFKSKWLAAVLAVSLLLIGYVIGAATAQPKIRVPASVTAMHCHDVAVSAGVLHQPRTSDSIGRYYEYWVLAMSSKVKGKAVVSRDNMFNAGIAVAVCLK